MDDAAVDNMGSQDGSPGGSSRSRGRPAKLKKRPAPAPFLMRLPPKGQLLPPLIAVMKYVWFEKKNLWSERDFAAHFRMSNSAWHKWKVRFEEAEREFEEARRSGRTAPPVTLLDVTLSDPVPRVFSLPEEIVERRELLRQIVEDPNFKFGTAVDFNVELFVRHDINVSPDTTRRDLQALGFVHKVRGTAPQLSDRDIRDRLAFANKMLELAIDPASLAFSDECYFGCGDTRRFQYVREGEEPEPIEEKRWVTKCHVFGIITKSQYGLWRLPASGQGGGGRGGCNSGNFTQVLGRGSKHLKDILKPENSAPLTLVLDGASIHTSTTTRQFFEEMEIKTLVGGGKGDLSWPANSPDLNPIENWWAILKQKVGAGECATRLDRSPETDELLHAAIKKAAASTPKEVFERLNASFTDRLRLCVALGGHYTGY
jgi:transposase